MKLRDSSDILPKVHYVFDGVCMYSLKEQSLTLFYLPILFVHFPSVLHYSYYEGRQSALFTESPTAL